MSTFVDQNYRSYSKYVFDKEPELLDPLSPAYHDTLKFSKGSNGSVIANKTIVNHREDCVDLCRSSFCNFRRITLRPRGVNGITVKGAGSGNLFNELRFETHGKTSDIELGQFDNYWYPGRPPTRDNYFSGEAVDGQKVVVWLWDAEASENSFHFKDGVKIIKVPKLVWFPYFMFRYLQIRAVNLIRRRRGQPTIGTE